MYVLLGYQFTNDHLSLLQDDYRAFRRQLEDKQHVVESSIQNGCQYIANDPPLSELTTTESNNPHTYLTKSHSVIIPVKFFKLMWMEDTEKKKVEKWI